MYDQIEALLDTRYCYGAALKEMIAEGVPFSAAEFFARRDRIDAEQTRRPIRVVAVVGRPIEA